MEKMKDIDISVIVTTYNQERYIREALESIVNQQFEGNIEVLIGEDCSTDRTADIVREYAEQSDVFVPFFREQNMGMVLNTFDLMKRVKGRYVVVIEGDDYWTDIHKLQKQFVFLEKNTEYVAVTHLCEIVDANGRRNQEVEKYANFCKEKEYTLEHFQNYELPGQTASCLIRSNVFEHLELIQKLFAFKNIQVDRVLVELFLSMGKIACMQEYMSAYRYVTDEKAGSWSAQNDNHKTQSVINFCNGLISLEQIGKLLNLKVDFEARRLYEIRKILENKEERKQLSYVRVCFLIMRQCKNPFMAFTKFVFWYVKYIVRDIGRGNGKR